jgi:hypothetical protein
MVGEVIMGIFFISVCFKTVLHVLKASVVNVDDIWGKWGQLTTLWKWVEVGGMWLRLCQKGVWVSSCDGKIW